MEQPVAFYKGRLFDTQDLSCNPDADLDPRTSALIERLLKNVHELLIGNLGVKDPRNVATYDTKCNLCFRPLESSNTPFRATCDLNSGEAMTGEICVRLHHRPSRCADEGMSCISNYDAAPEQPFVPDCLHTEYYEAVNSGLLQKVMRVTCSCSEEKLCSSSEAAGKFASKHRRCGLQQELGRGDLESMFTVERDIAKVGAQVVKEVCLAILQNVDPCTTSGFPRSLRIRAKEVLRSDKMRALQRCTSGDGIIYSLANSCRPALPGYGPILNHIKRSPGLEHLLCAVPLARAESVRKGARKLRGPIFSGSSRVLVLLLLAELQELGGPMTPRSHPSLQDLKAAYQRLGERYPTTHMTWQEAMWLLEVDERLLLGEHGVLDTDLLKDPKAIDNCACCFDGGHLTACSSCVVSYCNTCLSSTERPSPEDKDLPWFCRYCRELCDEWRLSVEFHAQMLAMYAKEQGHAGPYDAEMVLSSRCLHKLRGYYQQPGSDVHKEVDFVYTVVEVKFGQPSQQSESAANLLQLAVILGHTGESLDLMSLIHIPAFKGNTLAWFLEEANATRQKREGALATGPRAWKPAPPPSPPAALPTGALQDSPLPRVIDKAKTIAPYRARAVPIAAAGSRQPDGQPAHSGQPDDGSCSAGHGLALGAATTAQQGAPPRKPGAAASGAKKRKLDAAASISADTGKPRAAAPGAKRRKLDAAAPASAGPSHRKAVDPPRTVSSRGRPLRPWCIHAEAPGARPDAAAASKDIGTPYRPQPNTSPVHSKPQNPDASRPSLHGKAGAAGVGLDLWRDLHEGVREARLVATRTVRNSAGPSTSQERDLEVYAAVLGDALGGPDGAVVALRQLIRASGESADEHIRRARQHLTALEPSINRQPDAGLRDQLWLYVASRLGITVEEIQTLYGLGGGSSPGTPDQQTRTPRCWEVRPVPSGEAKNKKRRLESSRLTEGVAQQSPSVGCVQEAADNRELIGNSDDSDWGEEDPFDSIDRGAGGLPGLEKQTCPAGDMGMRTCDLQDTHMQTGQHPAQTTTAAVAMLLADTLEDTFLSPPDGDETTIALHVEELAPLLDCADGMQDAARAAPSALALESPVPPAEHQHCLSDHAKQPQHKDVVPGKRDAVAEAGAQPADVDAIAAAVAVVAAVDAIAEAFANAADVDAIAAAGAIVADVDAIATTGAGAQPRASADNWHQLSSDKGVLDGRPPPEAGAVKVQRWQAVSAETAVWQPQLGAAIDGPKQPPRGGLQAAADSHQPPPAATHTPQQLLQSATDGWQPKLEAGSDGPKQLPQVRTDASQALPQAADNSRHPPPAATHTPQHLEPTRVQHHPPAQTCTAMQPSASIATAMADIEQAATGQLDSSAAAPGWASLAQVILPARPGDGQECLRSFIPHMIAGMARAAAAVQLPRPYPPFALAVVEMLRRDEHDTLEVLYDLLVDVCQQGNVGQARETLQEVLCGCSVPGSGAVTPPEPSWPVLTHGVDSVKELRDAFRAAAAALQLPPSQLNQVVLGAVRVFREERWALMALHEGLVGACEQHDVAGVVQLLRAVGGQALFCSQGV